MTTPAIHALKNSGRGRRLTLLTSRSGAQAAPFIPDIDEVLCFDAPWVKHPVPPAPDASLDLRALIGSRKFDAAAIFTVYSQSPLCTALLCYLAGIPLRLAHCRENPYHLLTDWVKETEPAAGIRHEVQRQLDLLAAVGIQTADEHMRFSVSARAERAVDRLLTEAQVDDALPLVVLHPGASAASRRYPVERYAAVARQLPALRKCRLIVTGSNDERALTQTVCAGANKDAAIDFAGKLDVGQLGALIARADLLISNNTGPVHIASAVGTPVVDLYALTNPQHTPWQVPNRVLFRDVECR
ncbi:MAG TPA: glycosyltransferase family 9 protein, partial [Burkholderiales bacterium]|nr:glycosyltransferase family 9 protein [Burkholderiales bacterium]